MTQGKTALEPGTPARRRSKKPGGPSGHPMGGQLLNTREAAAYLGVNRWTLELWRTRKRRCGPSFIKLHAHAVRYRLRDLDAFLEGRLVKPERRAPGEKN